MHSKTLPLWNPFVLSGIPFLANPQTAVFYPFSYIFALFSFPVAFNIGVLLHTMLAGFLMYALARQAGIGKTGSVAAAVMYMFNGYFVFHFQFNSNISSYVWAPAILMFFRRALNGQIVINSIALAILLAIQLFAGHPQFVYYTVGLLIMYWLAFSATKEAAKKGAIVLAAAGALAILLSAAQILPTLELLAHSIRQKGVEDAWSVMYSVRPADMARFLFVPLWDIFNRVYDGDPHIIGFYFGLIPLLAVIFSGFKNKKREQWFFAAVFVLSLLLALGKYFPLYSLFRMIVPGWNFFKFPGQLIFLAAFSFSLLFGFAVDKMKHPLKIVVVLLCFIELFIFGQKANMLVHKSYYEIVTPNTAALLKDTGLFRYTLAPQINDMQPAKSDSTFQYWLNFKDMLYPNTGSAYNLFCADGRETLKLTDYDDLLNRIKAPSSPLLAMLNVKYIFLPWVQNKGGLALVNDGYIKLHLNKGYLQRFYLVPEFKTMPHTEILDYISSKDFKPVKEVVLADAGSISYFGKEEKIKGADTVVVKQYSINRIELETTSSKPVWLVAGEVFYPGWKAKVDGEKAEIYKANYVLRAVPVNSGRHTLVMEYDPWTFRLGALITLVTIFGILVWFLLSLRKK